MGLKIFTVFCCKVFCKMKFICLLICEMYCVNKYVFKFIKFDDKILKLVILMYCEIKYLVVYCIV